MLEKVRIMKRLLLISGILFFISCQSGNQKNESVNEPEVKTDVIAQDTLNIGGMFCNMCVNSIEKGVNELQGITYVKASLEDSTTVVKYDTSKIDLAQIEKAIEKRGYRVKGDL